ncbi:MAG: asparagine synthase [Candidatus Bathyarchaeota archaeon]
MPVAAIIAKENKKDVSRQIINMLEAMSYNKNIFSIATDNDFIKEKPIASLGLAETKMAIGRSGSFNRNKRFFAKYPTELGEELFLALDGYILGSSKIPNEDKAHDDLIVDLIEEKMKNPEDLPEAVKSILPDIHGAFTFAAMGRDSITVARDIFGFEPLYWSEDNQCVAFASERKALWKIGLKDLDLFPPGCVATVDGRTKTISRILSLARPQIVDISLQTAAERLAKMLHKIFSRDYGGIKEVGELFSGGIDSSLVAKILTDMGTKVTLYGTAVEEAYDIDAISRSASELGCELRLRTLALKEVENYLYKTIYSVEEANIMKAGIGLPFYAAMETANGNGAKFIFSGQGADEVFGGYSKYLRIVRSGYDKLNDELWKDIMQMSEVNLQRDGAIAMANNVDCYLPFLDLELIYLAMSFPARLKVKGPEDAMRTHVLRKAAEIVGLPESIVHMPKKAAQYSSGSDRAIRKLAAQEGKSPSEYVRHIFEKVLKEYHQQVSA